MPLVDTMAAAAAVGVPPGTVRQWANRGHLTRRGSDHRGRTLYELTEVNRVAADMRRQAHEPKERP